jgi:hypothetical protein
MGGRIRGFTTDLSPLIWRRREAVNIGMQEATGPDQLTLGSWDIAIHGSAVDERGKASIECVSKHSSARLALEYNPEDFTVTFGSDHFTVDAFASHLERFLGKSILLEATTLGVAELLLLIKALVHMPPKALSIVYAEPEDYSRSRRPNDSRREFELSDEVQGYRAIPGSMQMLSDRRPQRCVFFLGYEERRLDRALEDYPMLLPSLCAVVFGVPAYKPGWEMNAFANNLRVMRLKGIGGGVHYCGAQNPRAAYEVLEQVYKASPKGERVFVAPIGTKPTGIGAALFAATHPEVGILYDHPTKKTGRSKKLGNWHRYDIDLGS